MPDAYEPSRGQVEVDDLAQEPVGHLKEDARTVAGVDLAAERSPVLEVAECVDARADDLVRAHTLHVHDEVDATGIVLEARVVETLGAGEISSHTSPRARTVDGREFAPGGLRWPDRQVE